MKKKLYKWTLVSTFLLILQLIVDNTRAQQNTHSKKELQEIKTKHGTVKIFYDASANILDKQNVSQAKYYRLINYSNGNINGPIRDYYMNGKPMMIGYYANNSISKGNEKGKFIWYYENGKLFQTCNYTNGVLDGAYFEFYPSGLKKALISYVNGKRYGCEYAWDEEGTVTHRAFMEENGALYKRQECDTTYIERASEIAENSIALSEVFLKEYADGEYKEIDTSLYYKSKGIKILSLTVLNDNLDTISSSNIRAGVAFRVHITVIGFSINKDNMCDCSEQQEKLPPDGMIGGSVGYFFSEAKNGAFEIRLGDTPLYIKNKDSYLFFFVRDTISKNSIHGFYKYNLH